MSKGQWVATLKKSRIDAQIAILDYCIFDEKDG